MSSIIKVDTIQTAAGGTPTAADLGLNTTGSVLQVVNSTIGGSGTEVNTTSNSFSSTGHSASITPSSASSKILILTNGTIYNSTAGFCVLTMYRSIGGGANIEVTTGQAYGYSFTYGGSSDHASPSSCAHLDSPATTSECVYTVYFRNHGGGTSYYNLNGSRSNITLLEIAG